MTNDRSTVEAAIPGLEREPATESKLQLPYHEPSFVYYGTLAELVQAGTAAGSDGSGDCTHV